MRGKGFWWIRCTHILSTCTFMNCFVIWQGQVTVNCFKFLKWHHTSINSSSFFFMVYRWGEIFIWNISDVWRNFSRHDCYDEDVISWAGEVCNRVKMALREVTASGLFLVPVLQGIIPLVCVDNCVCQGILPLVRVNWPLTSLWNWLCGIMGVRSCVVHV